MRPVTTTPTLVRPVVTLLLALCLVGAGLLGNAAPASALTTKEARLVALINNARHNHGLRALSPRTDLNTYARRHARAMADRGYLYHTSNFTVIRGWCAIAENVAYNYSVYRVHRAFMNSAGHRANILGRYRGVGVGIVVVGNRLWVTEIFRRPC